MWVGSNLIIPDKEYAPLELTSASKRLLGNDTPQDNTKLSRAWTASNKHIPDQDIIYRYGIVYHIRNEMGLL